jgi:hypothetical protein
VLFLKWPKRSGLTTHKKYAGDRTIVNRKINFLLSLQDTAAYPSFGHVKRSGPGFLTVLRELFAIRILFDFKRKENPSLLFLQWSSAQEESLFQNI